MEYSPISLCVCRQKTFEIKSCAQRSGAFNFLRYPQSKPFRIDFRKSIHKFQNNQECTLFAKLPLINAPLDGSMTLGLQKTFPAISSFLQNENRTIFIGPEHCTSQVGQHGGYLFGVLRYISKFEKNSYLGQVKIHSTLKESIYCEIAEYSECRGAKMNLDGVQYSPQSL